MIPNNNNPNFDLYLPTNQIICVQCIKKHPQKVPLKKFDFFAASGEPFVKCPNMTIATFFKLVFAPKLESESLVQIVQVLIF